MARNNTAVTATAPRTSCPPSAGLPGHPQNCFLVIPHFSSPCSPTSSDGDPLHTVSTLQHFNKHRHMLCELNCADGTLRLQLNDTFHMMLPYINTGFRTEWVRKDLKQKGRKEERKEGRKEGKGREIWRSFAKAKTWTGLVARQCT